MSHHLPSPASSTPTRTPPPPPPPPPPLMDAEQALQARLQDQRHALGLRNSNENHNTLLHQIWQNNSGGAAAQHVRKISQTPQKARHMARQPQLPESEGHAGWQQAGDSNQE